MTENGPYPRYIERAREEQEIQYVLDAVQTTGRSQAILLYGSGGVGKTSLVRRMSKASPHDSVRWLEPIDVDDPDCWLLSNLETRVAKELAEGNDYFEPYLTQVSQLPAYTHEAISHETIVSHLSRLKDGFARCYRQYARETHRTVVITFDTVETIRGTSQLMTLTRWMKALPARTLFILSGRPGHGPDSIRDELEARYQGIPVTPITVGGFTQTAAESYILASEIAAGLRGEELDKLVLLTRGHPLWLAFAVSYLSTVGLPDEVRTNSLADIAASITYDGELPAAGEQLHDDFLRRLVAPYRDSDYWHEAIKRLAVLRQPVARDVWRRLMDDCVPPEGTEDSGDLWTQLLRLPWIRPRGGERYVTLHDAVAEALAQRLFPLHDQNQQWRHMVWNRALAVYSQLLDEQTEQLSQLQATLDERLTDYRGDGPARGPAGRATEDELIGESVSLERRRRDLDHLRAARLYYLFLGNFENGCEELLAAFQRAEDDGDVFFQDLLALYLQRFLPSGTDSEAFHDVIKIKLDEFREWLQDVRPGYFIRLGVMLARYLIDAGQPEAAVDMLDGLPGGAMEAGDAHQLHLLRANAYLRISGRATDGLHEFSEALRVAQGATTPDRDKLIAVAYKELGFYYRNTGQWQEADQSFRHARDTILRTLSETSSVEDRDEMASIQTMWAYVKGLDGRHGEGLELVNTAIDLRSRIPRNPKEGMSWSVCGEVYRYARRWHKAWDAYARAEDLLQGRRYWGWLGIIRQQQAICLYQAADDGLQLTEDSVNDSRRLIDEALDICLKHNIRAYPSALNRAGRIIGDADPDAGLSYLKDGINEARRLGDGWFWFANLMEYAELSYRAWQIAVDEHRPEDRDRHRADISGLIADINLVTSQFDAFPDLLGRWNLLQGHLAIHDYLIKHDGAMLDDALRSYITGFANLARRHIASSGSASIGGEFQTFKQLFRRLPAPVRADWQAKLRAEWSIAEDSAMLLAHLEELY